ncbi:MAG TPA: hypothetical protein GX731_01610 [Clostridiales bacterium]|nr:hypothetical protein [Clostridiales bacterium]
MHSQELLKREESLENYIRVQDYGSLTEDNLSDFLTTDIKIIVLGAKDWEMDYSEEALRITESYEDILYFFNFLDGSQFQKIMKSMKQKNCYRIPYEADPMAKRAGKKGLDLYDELIRMIDAKSER